MEQTGITWSQCLEAAALSDVGLVRANNQDSYAISLADNQTDFERRGHLFIVADGMGAHAAGELASKMATDIISMAYRKVLEPVPSDALLTAITDANHQIHSRGQASPDFRGMGTTATTLLLLPQGALLGHVGDSRAYRWRNNRLEQLTFDHSLVWEMRATQQFRDGQLPGYVSKNIITRSLGPRPTVKADLEGPHPLAVGDTFLLCSDGMSNQVRDEEIGLVLGCLPPQEAVRVLVDLACLRGGPDNITIVVAKVLGPQIAKDNGAPEHVMPLPSLARPVHPLIWTLIGVALLISVGLAAMGYLFPALLSFLCAGVGGAAALMQRYGDMMGKAGWERRRFGRGPYVACDCTPSADLHQRVYDLFLQLNRSAEEAKWPVDWEALKGKMARIAAAKTSGDFTEACRETLRAIMFIMECLRRHRDAREPDSNVFEEDEEDEEQEGEG